ncbi:anthranilate synthase component 1/para-aminobenzoate synthetase [Neomicrococcus aestuarii]|uniref:aminodeoxychorismate synthase n=1 Tax=Neomicrococcus aestuarii TaxID=556325 RepID=A0A7W8TUU1_9MICC|nr:aminodeoxychorismate synthase component I [Neomicrococcus aestuarii]MBB5513281.1 anthranilate synthase component 1/para-aminobenzoate synthetase [Neomicrococcus aestuarii]
MSRGSSTIIAIDGRSGAGKSTLALELATLLRKHRPVALFHLEDIYPGWDGLEEGIDLYTKRVAEPLFWGETAHWFAWDWYQDREGEKRSTPPAPIVIIEGVGANARSASRFIDAHIWVSLTDEERKRRALERDGETYAPHWDRWAQQEQHWMDSDNGPVDADITVNAARGSATETEAVLRALTELPAIREALRPEIEQQRALPAHARTFELPKNQTQDCAVVLFEKLYGESAEAFLLHSSSAGSEDPLGRNRYSILADASGALGATAQHMDGVTRIRHQGAEAVVPGPFFGWLDDAWDRRLTTSAPPLALEGLDFELGWLGWLGYELKREFGGADVSGSPTADAALIRAARAVIVDHETQTAHALAIESADADEFFDSVAAAVASLEAGSVAVDTKKIEDDDAALTLAGSFSIRDSHETYLAKIKEAQREIFEGNTYEVCLTSSVSARASTADPWAIYLALKDRSPAPYAAFGRFGATSIASSSPERFLSISLDGLMRAEPIKGTRRRLADPVEDAALKHELATSPKDRAENIMIVDLLRNDLVRSAYPATLRVPRLLAVESYATVHQMVSTIDAQLRPEISRAEAVRAAFPAGSMTGAPKISTMNILDRLEDWHPRGIYSGAIGYFSRNGGMNLSVVIRTLLMQQTQDGSWDLSLGIGGAITADSVPEEEWDELRAKAFGVLGTLGAEFPG